MWFINVSAIYYFNAIYYLIDFDSRTFDLVEEANRYVLECLLESSKFCCFLRQFDGEV